MESSKDHSSSGFWAGLFANTLWACSFLGSKHTLNAWKPFAAGTLRVGLATAFIFLGMWLLGKPIRRPASAKGWLSVFLVGLTGFGALYPMQLKGLTMIPSGLSACIMLTCPLFIIIFGVLLLSEKLELKKVIALAIGFVGGMILLHNRAGLQIGGQQFVAGSALTLMASVCFSLSAVLSRIATRHLDPYSATFWAMLCGFLTMLPVTVAMEPSDIQGIFVDRAPSAWAALLFLALICSAVCYFTWYFALSRATATELAATMYLKTPVAILLGVVLANESLTPSVAVGTLIITFSLWLTKTQSNVLRRLIRRRTIGIRRLKNVFAGVRY